MPALRFLLGSLFVALAILTPLKTPARAIEPAQDEALAYAIGVQSYISRFPPMDLYRTLWETSFDPEHLLTRHYSPRAPILTGDWVPPPVETR